MVKENLICLFVLLSLFMSNYAFCLLRLLIMDEINCCVLNIKELEYFNEEFMFWRRINCYSLYTFFHH